MIIAQIMFVVSVVLLICVLVAQLQEWLRLRNGCGKHEWINHEWNEPHCRQVRWCGKCGIRQVKLSDEYSWGPEYIPELKI